MAALLTLSSPVAYRAAASGLQEPVAADGPQGSVAAALVGAEEAPIAPGFVTVDRWGDRVRLSDYEGEVIVLHFFATWCASCRDDLRSFQRIHERFAERGVTVLGLAYASGDRDRVGAFVDELGVTFPTLMCREDTRAAYDVASYPTNVIVDTDGRIRFVMQRKMNESFWVAAIEELLAEPER